MIRLIKDYFKERRKIKLDEIRLNEYWTMIEDFADTNSQEIGCTFYVYPKTPREYTHKELMIYMDEINAKEAFLVKDNSIGMEGWIINT